MDVSPFPYQGPLEPEQLRGRDELVERVTERRVTALLGPRRYGKTSVLRRIASVLEAAGTSVVWVDLYELASVTDLVVRLDAGLHTARGPVRGRLAEVAAGAEVHLGVVKLSFARRREERPDPLVTLHLLLDTFVAAAADTPTVAIFDEFQSIVGASGAAGLLRTKLQHHVTDVGLLFAGSQPSLMTALFADPTMPFFQQADPVQIGPLSAAALHSIVTDGFTSTGRDPGPLAARIHDFSHGHPYRSMQLADAVWRQARPGGGWDARSWDAGLAALRAGTDVANEVVYAGFEQSEKLVLRLLASGRGLFGADAQQLGLTHGAAQHARQRLLAAGELVDEGGVVRVTDPVTADWLRRRLPA